MLGERDHDVGQQRARPAGGAEQAVAISSASSLPLSLR